ncbi:MAG: hypothetical protein IAF58_07080, partial [Leptolyngbya sp.]|nr:hypothetical protein [Candidatus Melainabacteria bacterium]
FCCRIFLGILEEHKYVRRPLCLTGLLHLDESFRCYLKRGIGGYHACYEVKSLDTAVILAQEQGCMIIGEPVPAVAFDNRRICWVFTPMRLLIELLEE